VPGCRPNPSRLDRRLQLLNEIAPGVTRAAVLRDPTIAVGPAQFAAIQAVAPSLGVELRPVDVRDEGEIERVIALFAQSPNSGLIVTGSPRLHLIAISSSRWRLGTGYPQCIMLRIGPQVAV